MGPYLFRFPKAEAEGVDMGKEVSSVAVGEGHQEEKSLERPVEKFSLLC
jgi:hypothetical protein